MWHHILRISPLPCHHSPSQNHEPPPPLWRVTSFMDGPRVVHPSNLRYVLDNLDWLPGTTVILFIVADEENKMIISQTARMFAVKSEAFPGRYRIILRNRFNSIPPHQCCHIPKSLPFLFLPLDWRGRNQGGKNGKIIIRVLILNFITINETKNVILWPHIELMQLFF